MRVSVKRIGSFLLAVLLTVSVSAVARAAGSGGTGNLIIRCVLNRGAENETPLEGMEYDMYLLATLTDPNDLASPYVVVEPYASEEGLGELAAPEQLFTSESQRELVRSYGTYINAHLTEPTFSATTNSNGTARFEGIPYGLYLVSSSTAVRLGSRTYTQIPFILRIPYIEEPDINNSITAYAKFQTYASGSGGGNDPSPSPDATPDPDDPGNGTGSPDDPGLPGDPPTDIPDSNTPQSNQVLTDPEDPETPPDTEEPVDLMEMPEELLDIPDEEVPTDNLELIDLEDEPVPLVNIEDEDAPMANMTDMIDLVTLEDEGVPLARLPQTGLLWWPVPVMAVGGILLFALGWKKRRNYE